MSDIKSQKINLTAYLYRLNSKPKLKKIIPGIKTFI